MRVDRRSLKRRRLRHVEGEVGLDRLHAASRREESAPEEVALGRAALPRPARAKPLAGRLEQRLDGPRAEQVTRGTFAPCLAMHVRATAVRRNDPIRDPQAYTAWIRRHQGGNTGLCRAKHREYGIVQSRAHGEHTGHEYSEYGGIQRSPSPLECQLEYKTTSSASTPPRRMVAVLAVCDPKPGPTEDRRRGGARQRG